MNHAIHPPRDLPSGETAVHPPAAARARKTPAPRSLSGALALGLALICAPLPEARAQTAPAIGGSGACTPTGGTDVIFLLDNSGSIDAAEYSAFANSVRNIGETLRAANPATRIAVAHYAGDATPVASFGQNIFFERDFSTAAISLPGRRFGPGGAHASSLIMDNLAGAVQQMSFGLDGIPGTTSSHIVSTALRELNRDLGRPLQIVLFTDAAREAVTRNPFTGVITSGDSAIIDGAGYAVEPGDGSNFTIYNLLKRQGVKFSVWAVQVDASRDAAAAAIASLGGQWTGAVEANPQDIEGSTTRPRRLVATNTFNLTQAQILEFVTPVANICPFFFDYGDAPASYGSPRHALIPGGPWLGSATTDSESAAHHSADALGDDQNGNDDEDGIAFGLLEAGRRSIATAHLSYGAQTAASLHLNGWIDWNRDGDFLDSGEQIALNLKDDGYGVDQLAGDGRIQFAVDVPAWAAPGPIHFSRFRLSTRASLAPDAGEAPDGEIEDHAVTVQAAPVAATPVGVCARPNLLLNGGFSGASGWTAGYPASPVTGPASIGATGLNSTLTGPPFYGPNADGGFLAYVDNSGNLGGVPYLHLRNEATLSLVNGQTYVFSHDVQRIANGASVNAVTDWVLINPTTNAIVQTIPGVATNIAAASTSWTQRAASFVATVPTGSYKLAMTFRVAVEGTGNVLDYQMDRVYFAQSALCDYGDAPASYGAPTHVVGGALRLGANAPDSESAAQHSPDATGDDLNGIDDEDGISAFPPLRIGATSYSLPASLFSAAGTGILRAWIDFDRNGAFAAAEHAAVTVTNGVLAGPLTWTGILVGGPGGTPGLSFARLRLTSTTLDDLSATPALDERATAHAHDGEVEDYAVTFAPPPSLPPDAGMALCHSPAGASGAGVWPIGWSHNDPPLTLNADSRWPELPTGAQSYGAFGPGIAGGAPLVPGAGLVYQSMGPGATSYVISEARASGAAYANAEQDHIGYSFTTAADLAPGAYLRRFSIYLPPAQSTRTPFRLTILLSTDPGFSSATVVLSDRLMTLTTRPIVAFDAAALLEPATTYHLRAVFHDVASSSGQIFWDDFMLDLGSCADMSDAPASYGLAHHMEGSVAMRLGATRSPDLISIVSSDAMGDGATDDGVFFGPRTDGVPLQGATLAQGQARILEFAVTGAGRLSGWIDWNRDGIFSPGAETVVSGLADDGPDDGNPAPGVIRVTVTPPPLVEGPAFARFRWSSAPWLGPLGAAPDGEVEDYALLLVAQPDAAFLLTPDHDATVAAGQLAIHPHRLLVGAGLGGGALSFLVESERDPGWILLRDDGDGVHGAGDLPWVQGAPIPAGDHAFWLVARIPADAPAGWSDLTRLTATILSGARSGSSMIRDLTRVGGGASGGVFARKLQALDADCDGGPDGGEPGFTPAELPIASGGCAVYRIAFENRGVETIRQVRVQDHTPSWMVYVAGSAEVLEHPPGLTLLPFGLPSAGAEGEISFPFGGSLEPGEGGVVQFVVRLPGN
ncbi:GEVED domain-containing protein [Neomegalonema sp.]|uniref:GEVED domain-containing protein n=1 Tax=Neomegalonema sp. TaxID=2039713 RepID=UPI00262E49AB|nr:GEVED domain-containing protein [Neomegalonema sp.]MDD2869704.1 GEVED domain-containing protein [Neomegalonema sp.]